MVDLDDERAWIAKSQQGDLEAFEALIRRYQRMIHSLTFRMTGSMADSEDVTQETFIQGFRLLHTFRQKSKFSSWIYRVAIKTCLNWKKRAQRRAEAHQQWGEHLELESATQERSDNHLTETVQETLMKLNPKQRAAVILTIYDGHAEAAKIADETELKGSVNPQAGKPALPKRLFALLIASLACILPAAAPAAEVLTVAVFNFESTDEGIRDLGPKAATLVSATLSAEPDLITVERAELEKALGEMELGLSGTVAPDTAAKVGHLTGAKVLVTGRIFKVDKELVMVAKVIGTETSRVYGEIAKGPDASALTDISSDLAKKIAKTVTQKGDTLVAKVESKKDRIERIRKSVGGGKLPAVSVKIPEHHFGQPVRDPAAETELSLVLGECGFTVVDDKSKQKADMEITGEAFSALGLRKGNLISCKARVELTVHDVTHRKLLAKDRETSVAVDIAEQTAAKTALENAALDLAERLLPKMAK